MTQTSVTTTGIIAISLVVTVVTLAVVAACLRCQHTTRKAREEAALELGEHQNQDANMHNQRPHHN